MKPACARPLTLFGLAVGMTTVVALVPLTRGVRAAERAPVTFNDIAPLVFDRCVRCHNPNGPAPFSLVSYADVKRRASLVAAMTASRLMPPWKSEPGYGEFLGQQPLS